MMGPRISAFLEKAPSLDAELALRLITDFFKSPVIVIQFLNGFDYQSDVDDRLGADGRDRRAADMVGREQFPG